MEVSLLLTFHRINFKFLTSSKGWSPSKKSSSPKSRKLPWNSSKKTDARNIGQQKTPNLWHSATTGGCHSKLLGATWRHRDNLLALLQPAQFFVISVYCTENVIIFHHKLWNVRKSRKNVGEICEVFDLSENFLEVLLKQFWKI